GPRAVLPAKRGVRRPRGVDLRRGRGPVGRASSATRDRGADDLRGYGRGALPAPEAAQWWSRARRLRPAGARRGAGCGSRCVSAEAAGPGRTDRCRQEAAWRGLAGRSPREGGELMDERITSGDDGLDQILGGGLPPNAINLIMGLPGSGKTILCQQFM